MNAALLQFLECALEKKWGVTHFAKCVTAKNALIPQGFCRYALAALRNAFDVARVCGAIAAVGDAPGSWLLRRRDARAHRRTATGFEIMRRRQARCAGKISATM